MHFDQQCTRGTVGCLELPGRVACRDRSACLLRTTTTTTTAAPTTTTTVPPDTTLLLFIPFAQICDSTQVSCVRSGSSDMLRHFIRIRFVIFGESFSVRHEDHVFEGVSSSLFEIALKCFWQSARSSSGISLALFLQTAFASAL